ncbi:MAG: FliO/MopB family protein [Clostridiales bacterium]|nr:FliO/MopB family protein [Clostridiales bacterium]
MDFEFVVMIIKLIFGLVVIFGLMMIVIKFSNNSLKSINNKKYINIIDRMQISKETYIVVVKIGKKGMVLLTSSRHTEKLQELTQEEIEEIQEMKRESYENMTHAFDKLINKIKSKEDKNE